MSSTEPSDTRSPEPSQTEFEFPVTGLNELSELGRRRTTSRARAGGTDAAAPARPANASLPARSASSASLALRVAVSKSPRRPSGHRRGRIHHGSKTPFPRPAQANSRGMQGSLNSPSRS